MKYVIAALLLVAFSTPALSADVVTDAAAAEKIGMAALKDRLGDYTYAKYTHALTWVAVSRGDYWFAMPVNETQIGLDPAGLTGWIVQIDRHNGHPLGVYLQF